MARIAVVGLGSIGSIFAGHLIQGGRHSVLACTRRPVERIIVESANSVVDVPVDCVMDPARATPADWVLLTTKSQDTPGAAPWLAALCGGSTTVIVLQNGVDHAARINGLCGNANILPTVVFANGKRLERGRIRHLCPGDDLVVPAGALGESCVALFSGTLLKVRTAIDFGTVSWRKFLANIVANPMTALTGRGIEVVRGGEMEQLALTLLKEATAVGQACGVALPDDTPETILRWMAQYPGTTETSMLQDRRDGKPLEHEALTGTVVRLGRLHGIATPVNRAVAALLEAVK